MCGIFFVLLSFFTTKSLCFMRPSFKKEVSGFEINSSGDLPYKIALSYDGSLIACVNVTKWPKFYRLNSTGDYQEITKIDEANYTYDIVFARKSLNYVALKVNVNQSSQIHSKTIQVPPFSAQVNGQNLAIGNNDKAIAYSTAHPNNSNYSLVYVLTPEFEVIFNYQCLNCGNVRMVLSGKSLQKAVVLKEYEELQVVRLITSPQGNTVHQYQTLTLYGELAGGISKWMAVDFSYDENFIVASIQPNTFTVWMLTQGGSYAEAQTENLNDGAKNLTIQKLHFSNDEQRLFVGTDREARIYIKSDLVDTQKPFKLGYSIQTSLNSMSDMSSDGTTVASMNKTSVRIIKIVDDSILYKALLLGGIPLAIAMIIILFTYVVLRQSKNTHIICQIEATFFEIKQQKDSNLHWKVHV